MSLFISFGDQIDEHQRAEEQGIGVKQIRDYLEGGDLIAQHGGLRYGDEHLRAVGDYALEDAGEGIEQGSGLSRRNAVILRHLLGDGVCHDDSDGVVRGRDVHRADE